MRKGSTTKKPLTMEQRKLVSENIGLAEAIATKRVNRFMSPEDRLQNAYLGLIDAARMYDPSRDVKFSAYATARIHGAIIDAERNDGVIHVARVAKGKERIMGTFKQPISFELFDDPGDWLFVAPEPPEPAVDPETIQVALAGLPERDRTVAKRYWLDGVSMKRIASEIGVVESRVSQMIGPILDRLRNHTALADYAKGA